MRKNCEKMFSPEITKRWRKEIQFIIENAISCFHGNGVNALKLEIVAKSLV